ncbi:hypothetical protein CLOM_g10150 [Closterium sp. NIES-68]|nr:hypothetical protein CLOM_g10150 [Closterium sp. NIES-68]GJP71678.1 hypothetical protein CLOP_g2489 [Closterium sp. NIES-67]
MAAEFSAVRSSPSNLLTTTASSISPVQSTQPLQDARCKLRCRVGRNSTRAVPSKRLSLRRFSVEGTSAESPARRHVASHHSPSRSRHVCSSSRHGNGAIVQEDAGGEKGEEEREKGNAGKRRVLAEDVKTAATNSSLDTAEVAAGAPALSAAERDARIEEMGGMAVMQRAPATEPGHKRSSSSAAHILDAHTLTQAEPRRQSQGHVPPSEMIETATADAHSAGSEHAAAGGFGAPLWADIRRKVPHMGSDVRDGLHPAAAASTMFLFFACLTPCIAFGGLTAAQTGGAIGVVETILGTAISGVVYALFSGQPLTLLGPTGLVVVFTGLLYKSAAALSLPFLPVYAWVSVWSAAFLLVLSLTGASDLIRLFTRFTDETFSLLISLGFIAEPCKKLAANFAAAAAAATAAGAATAMTAASSSSAMGGGGMMTSSVALLSMFVAVATWRLTSFLSTFRESPYLTHPLRALLSDFAAPIAILLMSALPSLLLPSVPLPTLSAPAHIVTTSGRPWLVPILGSLPPWAMLLCAVPAALLTLLVFLDQNITTRLVDAPSNGLRKGSGYHLDLAVLAVIMLLSAAVGLPWMVASTVPSLSHVRSLAFTESAPAAAAAAAPALAAAALAAAPPSPPQQRVRENRVTGVAIHVCIGASLLLLPLLSQIPVAVTEGLFLFMGFSSLAGNQLVDRLKLVVTDPSRFPDYPFIRGVARSSVYGFTALQGACLVALWQLKHSKLGIFFPLLILALMPIRNIVAGRMFPSPDLAVLDAH